LGSDSSFSPPKINMPKPIFAESQRKLSFAVASFLLGGELSQSIHAF